ncbi:DASH family cryptochrome [Litorivicinus sp.]|nr:DASH family cryptochrome [Litorivicinus sp.]
MRPNAIVWLVRDTCRLADNPSLTKATLLARSHNALLIPLVCFEPRRWVDQQFGLARIGLHWIRFRLESLRDLEQSLIDAESNLWISAGEPSSILDSISQSLSVIYVVTDYPLATEEYFENKRLEESGYSVVHAETDDLFNESDLPFPIKSLPDTFTKFRTSIEKKVALKPNAPLVVPMLTPLHEQPWPRPSKWLEACQINQEKFAATGHSGGRDAGLIHWEQYLDSRALSHYKQTRNALEGVNQSSHLSPWLAHGCLSTREIWHDVLTYESAEGANESTYWLRFELLWREYFRWYSRRMGSALFCAADPKRKIQVPNGGELDWVNWTRGTTDCLIVNAGMRELAATGWISNRMRQLVSSYFIHTLKLNWRLGAAWFESMLIDYDVASNWGNWAYIAGVGADPRGGRAFDIEDQADRYDPDGSYQKRWLGK